MGQISVKEAAKILNISENSVLRYIKLNQLKAQKTLSPKKVPKYLIDEEDLEAFKEQYLSKAKPETPPKTETQPKAETHPKTETPKPETPKTNKKVQFNFKTFPYDEAGLFDFFF